MSTVEEKQKERTEVRSDLLAHKKPKRVFVNAGFSFEAACGLANIDIKTANYDMALVEQAFDKVCETFPSDTMPAGGAFRHAFHTQFMGSKNWRMGSNGTFQHPEIEHMSPDEYDELIKDPFKFIMETIGPRTASRWGDDPFAKGMRLAAGYMIQQKLNGDLMAIQRKLSAKYGYVQGLITHMTGATVPFDWLSNGFRGFVGINRDVRRCPDKVKAAVNALLPLTLKRVIPPVTRPGLICFVPLHLGPFLNKKAFDDIYWPVMEKMTLELDKAGIACCFFVESNWTRLCPYLERLPKSSIFYMEQGDPKVFSDTVGRDHIIGGFYDPTITLTRSKEECIDAAKKLLDIVMKTGKYYFCFDKGVMHIKSIDVGKLQAVLEWVTENARY